MIGCDCRMAKFDKEGMKKTKLAVTTLKSTGRDKFAVEEKEEVTMYSCC